jgi:N-acetylglutamate synthase-like GNAT family acetyltransferase
LIRQARPEDRAALQRLYEATHPDAPVRVIASRIEEIQESPHHFLLLHETEGRVDGTLFVTLCLDPMFGTLPFAVVENLAVDAGESGEEVGRRLRAEAENIAREHRSTKMLYFAKETKFLGNDPS